LSFHTCAKTNTVSLATQQHLCQGHLMNMVMLSEGSFICKAFACLHTKSTLRRKTKEADPIGKKTNLRVEETLKGHRCNPLQYTGTPTAHQSPQPDRGVCRDGAPPPLWATCASTSLPLGYKTSSYIHSNSPLHCSPWGLRPRRAVWCWWLQLPPKVWRTVPHVSGSSCSCILPAA